MSLSHDQFGIVQGAGSGQFAPDFLNELVSCLPPAYRPPEHLDFLKRFLTPNAEDLTRWNQVFDNLYTYLDPFICPEDWLDWIIAEWFGWTLIPDGYPISRKRRLLAHLAADLDGSGIGFHYQNRSTITGLRNLLLEFGVHAIVTDAPMYVGGYVGADFPGSLFPAMVAADPSPLGIRVIVQYYDAAHSDLNTYAAGYLGTRDESSGNVYLQRTAPLVTDDFVVKLVEWERAAGVKAVIEWRTFSYRSAESLGILG